MKHENLRVALICVALGIVLILSPRNSLAASIREIKGTNRSLIPIQTALGFSTILEFQSKPLSAVLGDQWIQVRIRWKLDHVKATNPRSKKQPIRIHRIGAIQHFDSSRSSSQRRFYRHHQITRRHTSSTCRAYPIRSLPACRHQS